MPLECSIPGCGRAYRAKGLCSTHWQRQAGYIKKPLDQRIDGSPAKTWAKEVALCHITDVCLTTPFKVGTHGYSEVSGGMTLPHYICVLLYGEPKVGQEACHSCGNRLCCAPRHLRWGTRSDNVQDAIAHGTFFFPPGRY